jgi:hypothetical protein
MKQMIIAVSLLLLAGVGCDKEQDRQLPDGTKIFGERTFNDGSLREIVRVELPNGKKKFNVTLLADGTEKAERVEYPDGDKWFDVTNLPDGPVKIGRIELPNGVKKFDVTTLPDGTEKIGRAEFTDGVKWFDYTSFRDGPVKSKTGREELPNGTKWFDTTAFRDGTITTGRGELPNGAKKFDMTRLPDGTLKTGRMESPDGEKYFDVIQLPDGTEKIGREVKAGRDDSRSNPVEILSANRERPNPMSAAFMPVLMVRNNSAENREIQVRWYAIDDGVTVEQGICYTVGPLLAQSTTRVPYNSLVLGHPNATIKLGAIEQHAE